MTQTARPSFMKILAGIREIINTAFLFGIFSLLAINVALGTKTRATAWEYRVESIEDTVFSTTVERLGSEGWEIASARRAIAGEGGGSRGLYEVIFKRPITKAS